LIYSSGGKIELIDWAGKKEGLAVVKEENTDREFSNFFLWGK